MPKVTQQRHKSQTFEQTRAEVVGFVKERSPEQFRDKRIAAHLDLPVKVVRACLHFHSAHEDHKMRIHYRSPFNVRRKRPVWFYDPNYKPDEHEQTQKHHAKKNIVSALDIIKADDVEATNDA